MLVDLGEEIEDRDGSALALLHLGIGKASQGVARVMFVLIALCNNHVIV